MPFLVFCEDTGSKTRFASDKMESKSTFAFDKNISKNKNKNKKKNKNKNKCYKTHSAKVCACEKTECEFWDISKAAELTFPGNGCMMGKTKFWRYIP